MDVERRNLPPIWVIYDHPTDFPDHFVVRVAWGLDLELNAQLASDLEGARRLAIAAGASFCLGRSPHDPLVIAECWI